MAITINTTPLAINPAYSAINWNVTSNDVTIKAIRADIYINGSYSTTVDAVQQLGSTSIFNVDVRKIMQSQLVSELRTNITTFQITNAVTSACSVKIRLYEILLTAGVYTTTWAAGGLGTGYVESSTYNVVNMSKQPYETLTDWTVDSSAKKLLTLRTRDSRIPRGVPFQIGFLSASTNLYCNIEGFDKNGASDGGHTSTALASATYGKAIIEIPASIFATSTIKYMTVVLKNGSGALSETYRFKIEDYVTKYPVFIQNHLGDFDHFNFGAKIEKNVNTSNQRITKPLSATPNTYDAGTIIVQSNVNERLKVTTAALSAVELTFLQEFIKNHSVSYYWSAANAFYRKHIVSHSTKVEDSEELINTLSLTFEPSNDHIAQKGD